VCQGEDETEEQLRQRQQEAMAALKAQLEEVDKNLTAGYKQRCMAETKVVKGRVKDKRPQEEWGLSDEDRERAARAAVQAMRDKYLTSAVLWFSFADVDWHVWWFDRHLTELQKLKEQQQSTRSQRKDKLMDKLRRRRDKHNLDLSDADLEKDAEAALNDQVSVTTTTTVNFVANFC
jgi:hypothetical protein